MTSERTSPPSGPVASQLRSLSADESASPPSAARAAGAQETSTASSRNAEENFRSKRFFIFNTTVFKFYELRGGGFSKRTARLLSLSRATLQSRAASAVPET